MEKKSNGILGTPENLVTIFDAFNYLTSGISGTLGGYYRRKLSKLDARINGQRLANEVRARAVKAASAAVAIFSLSAIDISVGTPQAIVMRSIGEGTREAHRILETTL
jgi:hypothetical protein